MADDSSSVLETGASSSEMEVELRDKACQKKCEGCGFLNHIRKNDCSNCDRPFPQRQIRETVKNKQPVSKTKQRMLSYADQLHLKGYDVVIMTRKHNEKRPMHGSTWLWGTDGTGAAFAKTKICSLAAKGFGNFISTSSSAQTSASQTPTAPSSLPHTNSESQTSNTCTTSEMLASNQSSSSQCPLQLATPTSLASSSVCSSSADTFISQLNLPTSSPSASSTSLITSNQKRSHVMSFSSSVVSQSEAHGNDGMLSKTSSSSIVISPPLTQQDLSSHAAYFQGRSVALLDDTRRVQAYGVVTGQSTVHGRTVPPEHLAVNVTTVLQGCTLSPIVENPFEDGVIMEGGYYVWPMTRLALPSHLRPITNA